MDSRGGSALKESMTWLRPTGRAVSFGVSSLVSGPRRSLPRVLFRLLQTPLLTPIGLAMSNRGVYGLNMLKLFDSEEGTRILLNAFDQALDSVQSGFLKPVVAKVFPLAKADEAHEYLQSRKSVGKVVLIC